MSTRGSAPGRPASWRPSSLGSPTPPAPRSPPERPLRGAVRPRLPDLRQRAQRRADAGRSRGKAQERSGCRTEGGDCGTAEDYRAPGAEGTGLMTVSTHVLDAVTGRWRRSTRRSSSPSPSVTGTITCRCCSPRSPTPPTAAASRLSRRSLRAVARGAGPASLHLPSMLATFSTSHQF